MGHKLQRSRVPGLVQSHILGRSLVWVIVANAVWLLGEELGGLKCGRGRTSYLAKSHPHSCFDQSSLPLPLPLSPPSLPASPQRAGTEVMLLFLGAGHRNRLGMKGIISKLYQSFCSVASEGGGWAGIGHPRGHVVPVYLLGITREAGMEN